MSGYVQHTCVGNVASALDTSSGTEETEDGVLDVVRVVQGQQVADDQVDISVGMLLGNLALSERVPVDVRAGGNGTEEPSGDDGVLHVVDRRYPNVTVKKAGRQKKRTKLEKDRPRSFLQERSKK